MERTLVNITEYSYEEFVSFIFNREIQAKEEKYHSWYYDVEVVFDAIRVCEFYTRLFRDPKFLLGSYSKAQLEQGSWAIHGDAFDCSAQRIIEDTDVPFSLRCECIRSMFDLFSKFFATEPLETSVLMWWDSICYDWTSGIRDRQRGGEDESLQEVIFDVLAGLLQSDSDICQDAALHGLGHLHHPKTAELIQRYLEQHPLLNAKRRQYAVDASTFDIQ